MNRDSFSNFFGKDRPGQQEQNWLARRPRCPRTLPASQQKLVETTQYEYLSENWINRGVPTTDVMEVNDAGL